MNTRKTASAKSVAAAPTVADNARSMSDAMYRALLPRFTLETEHLKLVRDAFTAYCAAHPHHADVRTAWRAFHHQLETALKPQPVLTTA